MTTRMTSRPLVILVVLLGCVWLADSTSIKHGGQDFAGIWFMARLDGAADKKEYTV
jgi:hypothetical protein